MGLKNVVHAVDKLSRGRALAAVVASAGIALTGCGGGSSSATPTATPDASVVPTTTTPTTTTTTTPVVTTPATPTTTPTPTTTSTPSTGTTTPTTTTPVTTTPVVTPTPAATPTTTYSTVVDWTRTETPIAWDFKPQYPSVSACGVGEGRVFEIGTGKTYANPRNLNWLSLKPCDTVKIYYRATPYNDIVYIGSRGDKNKWITIQGVPGPAGELPTFDGRGAVMPVGTGANMWNDSTGLFIIQAPDPSVAPTRVSNFHPGYLHITGLKFQNANKANNVTNLDGATRKWQAFSSGISATGIEHMAISYCEFYKNGNGLFVNSTNGPLLQSRDLLVRHNYFHENGVIDSSSEHNAYTEVIGSTYEYNYFDAPVLGTGGLNIKERSPGFVFRYNYVHNGSILLGLMDPDSNGDYEKNAVDAWGENLNATTFVYSNILVIDTPPSFLGVPIEAPIVLMHGAGGTVSAWNQQIRHGNVYFYNNRVISKFDSRMTYVLDTTGAGVPINDSATLFTMGNTRLPATLDARNNLFYGTSATSGAVPRPLALFGLQGSANFVSNWITTFVNARFLAPFGTYNVGTAFNGTGLNGLTASTASPGFVNAAAGNYLTTSASPFASLNAAFPDAVVKRGLKPDGVSVPPVTPFGR